MEFRKRAIFSGQVLDVPKYVVRLDSRRTHGWQLRYGEWKLFSDFSNDGSGAEESLRLATEELARRISKLPAPTRLRTDPMANKTSEMPLGISGPAVRRRKGKNVSEYYLQVTYPIAGAKPANKSVYIATENTLTREKYDAALAKAIAMRETAVRKFKLATTKAQREKAAAAGLGRAEA
jgi:hypothetical protein